MAHAKINTLNDLDKAVKATAEGAKKTRKERYRLARDLGFSSAEAVYLQNRPEIIIRRLAKERTANG